MGRRKTSENKSLLSLGWKALVSGSILDFSGRSSRKEYWGVVLCLYLFASPLFAIIFKEVDLGVLGLIVSLGVIAVAILTLAIVVRRLHDLGQNAWMLALLPALMFSLDELLSSNFEWIEWSIPILFFLILAFLPGQVGENKWGEDPNDDL